VQQKLYPRNASNSCSLQLRVQYHHCAISSHSDRFSESNSSSRNNNFCHPFKCKQNNTILLSVEMANVIKPFSIVFRSIDNFTNTTTFMNLFDIEHFENKLLSYNNCLYSSYLKIRYTIFKDITYSEYPEFFYF